MRLTSHGFPPEADGPSSWLQTLDAWDFIGTPGNDRIDGTGSPDRIDVSQGGKDVVKPIADNDFVYFGAAFTGADRVNGGKGIDTVALDGDYSGGVEVQANSLVEIESLVLSGGSFTITGYLGFQQAGVTFVDAHSLTAGQSLNIDVGSVGDLDVVGGAGADVIHAAANGGSSLLLGDEGNDTLIGGSGATRFVGQGGADRIEMAGASDLASYDSKTESTGKSYDTIENFGASGGKIWLLFDSDEAVDGVQFDFHLGKTAERVGDVTAHYKASIDQTIVKVFTNADDKADFVVHLTGDIHVTAADFVFGFG